MAPNAAVIKAAIRAYLRNSGNDWFPIPDSWWEPDDLQDIEDAHVGEWSVAALQGCSALPAVAGDILARAQRELIMSAVKSILKRDNYTLRSFTRDQLKLYEKKFDSIRESHTGNWTVPALEGNGGVRDLARRVRGSIDASLLLANEVTIEMPERGPRPLTTTRPAETRQVLSDLASKRAVAHSMLVATAAAEDEDVRRFRCRFLGNRLLDADGARAFLSSPANAVLGPSTMERLNVAFTAHRAEIVGCERFAERLEDCGPDARAFYLHVLPIMHRERVRKQIGEMYVMRCRHEIVLQFTHPIQQEQPQWMEHDIRDCHEGSIDFHEAWPYWPNSVLAELKRLIDSLCRAYPAWNEPGACAFVLTGRAPEIPPVTWATSSHFGFPTHGKISIEAEPWLPEADLLKAYRDARAAMCGPAAERLGGGARGYEVLTFVCEHAGMAWPALYKLWQRTCPPKWRYSAQHGFKQAYERARRDVGMRPWGILPKGPATDPLSE